MALPLVSAEEFTESTGLTVPAVRLWRLLDQASAAARAFCGWSISAEPGVTFTLDGPGSALLRLPTLRLLSVESVTENGVVVPESGYRWSARGLVERVSGCWTRNLRGVTVTCDHGFAVVPDDVRAAVISVVSREYATPAAPVASQTMGSASITYVEGSRPSVGLWGAERESLTPYRIVGLA